MYPRGCGASKFYGLPKIHKQGTPCRPIVSSCGSVTYGVAEKLTKIIKPLVGKSPHHISVLFTSVPVEPSLGIIKDLLEKDPTLKERIVMSVGDIVLLLEFCLKTTYFSFQDQFYEQVEGVAMGCLVSLIVANPYMEYFEQKALSTASQPQVMALVCG